MKGLYYIFLTLAIVFVSAVLMDGCNKYNRIKLGSLPDDNYTSVSEAHNIIFAAIFVVLTIVIKIYLVKVKAGKIKDT